MALGFGYGSYGNYNSELAASMANYQNVLSAYTSGQANLSGNLGGIYAGYGSLGSQIANTLGQGTNGWGVAGPAATAITQAAAKQRGTTDQQMINAGLGNTTVRQNLQNQNNLFENQAFAGLGSQLAQTYAGYQAQIGSAGLAARMQGLGMQTNLFGQEGSALAGYRFPQVPYGGYGGGGSGGGSGGASLGGPMPHIGGGFGIAYGGGGIPSQGGIGANQFGSMGSSGGGGYDGGWGSAPEQVPSAFDDQGGGLIGWPYDPSGASNPGDYTGAGDFSGYQGADISGAFGGDFSDF